MEGKMKRTLYSVCIGSLALALTAGAQQDNEPKLERARPQHRTATVQTTRPANIGAIRNTRSYNSTAQYRQRSYSAPNRAFNESSRFQTLRDRNAERNERFREQNFARNEEFRARRDAAFSRDRNVAINRARDLAIDQAGNFNTNRERDIAMNRTRNLEMNRFGNTNELRRGNNFGIGPERNFAVNRTRNFDYYRPGNLRITNNWHSEAFRGLRYAPFHNYQRVWHDRGWWRSHYDRIVFVNGGWYYWNAGYWFPAWGYDPYVTYVYDGPIYGYDGLPPDQVTVDVQTQLAAAGYYDGPIDGVLGPMTREAIANFQADNGLAVTSAIDEPTLATMGLV
jgi:putative peptidoglycan binding protein